MPANMKKKIKKRSPGELGWIDRNGKFYACHYHGHAELAKRITGSVNGERELEQKGWIKLAGDPPIDKWHFFYMPKRPIAPSQRQFDFVFDWCRKKNKHFPPAYIDDWWEDLQAGMV